MDDRTTPPTPPSDEASDGDVDDQFRSLLEGLRTTLPGVQLIAGFLLIVPFQVSFADLSHAERGAFHVAFVCALSGSLLLMAPSSHQRLRAKPDGTVARETLGHVRTATRLAIAGSALFALALVAVAYLVASVVLNTAVAIVLTVVVALVAGWSWFYLPLVAWSDDQ
ncbi:MAG: DUF6328 family protein [Actinomycetota bacterium]